MNTAQYSGACLCACTDCPPANSTECLLASGLETSGSCRGCDEAGLDLVRESGRPRPSDTPKHGSEHKPRTTEVIVVKDTTRDLAGSVETRDERTIAVQHFCRCIGQHAAVGEGDAAAHAVRHKRRRLQAQSPVGLHRFDALGAFAVLDGW